VRIRDVVGVVVVVVDVDDDDTSVVEVEVWVEVEEGEGWANDGVEEATGRTLWLEAYCAVLVAELGEMEVVAEREVVLEVPGAEAVVEEELINDDQLVDTVVELEALLEGRWVVVDAELNELAEAPDCQTLDDGKVKAEELWDTLLATGEEANVEAWTLVVLVVEADVAVEDATVELLGVDVDVLVLPQCPTMLLEPNEPPRN
jgi:hypothetical protein